MLLVLRAGGVAAAVLTVVAEVVTGLGLVLARLAAREGVAVVVGVGVGVVAGELLVGRSGGGAAGAQLALEDGAGRAAATRLTMTTAAGRLRLLRLL